MFVVAGRADLLDRVAHLLRGHELALLHVHRPPGPPAGDEQVGLPGEERGDLEDVDDLRRDGRLLGLVDVGQHRHAELVLHPLEDDQPVGQPRPAEAGVARAVGLVEAGLEDVRQPELVADAFHVPRDRQAQVGRLDHAGAGDDEQRGAVGLKDVVMGRYCQRSIHELDASTLT